LSDVFTKARRSEVMWRIRGRGNKETELALVRLLRQHRITGWRRQIQTVGFWRVRAERESQSEGNAGGRFLRKPGKAIIST